MGGEKEKSNVRVEAREE